MSLGSKLESSVDTCHAAFEVPRVCSSKEEYLAGIERARQEGLIVDLEGDAHQDAHGHISHGLMTYNTRGGNLVTDALLNLAGDYARVLELGHGAGALASAINCRFPFVQLDTVGLEPINPYLRFAHWNCFVDERSFIGSKKGSAWNVIKSRWIDDYSKEAFDVLIKKGAVPVLVPYFLREKAPVIALKGTCSLDLFFMLHSGLESSALTYVDEPIVQRQFVGCMDEKNFSQLDSYDLIFERLGPIHYASDGCKALAAAIEHVNEGGAMLTTVDLQTPFRNWFEGCFRRGGFDELGVVAVFESGLILFLKEGHSLYEMAAVTAGEEKYSSTLNLDSWILDAAEIA